MNRCRVKEEDMLKVKRRHRLGCKGRYRNTRSYVSVSKCAGVYQGDEFRNITSVYRVRPVQPATYIPNIRKWADVCSVALRLVPAGLPRAPPSGENDISEPRPARCERYIKDKESISQHACYFRLKISEVLNQMSRGAPWIPLQRVQGKDIRPPTCMSDIREQQH